MREEILALQPEAPDSERLTPQLRALVEQGPHAVITLDHYPKYDDDISNQLTERTF